MAVLAVPVRLSTSHFGMCSLILDSSLLDVRPAYLHPQVQVYSYTTLDLVVGAARSVLGVVGTLVNSSIRINLAAG